MKYEEDDVEMAYKAMDEFLIKHSRGLLKCPACESFMITQEDDGSWFRHSCRHNFGVSGTGEVHAEVVDRKKEAMFVLDDPEKLSEGDGKMIEELATAIMLDEVAAKPKNVIHHGAVCCELNELYEKKNRDYGDSFHKTYLEEGMAMARIRLTDKLERFKKLTREVGQEVKDESIRDTLIDLANYAIMTVMEMDRESAE